MEFKADVTHLPLSTKLRRGVWMAIWRLFGMPGPRMFSAWRQMLLRAFGARIGSKVLICGGVKVLMPWNLQIDDLVAVAEGVDIYNFGQVHIHSNCCISQRVFLCTGSHDYRDKNFPLIWRDITIGSNSWLAADVFVGPGVAVSEGVVVGARSVVTRDLEAWGVYAGNPCVRVRERDFPT